MKKFVFVLIICLINISLFSQKITNVNFRQDGTKVIITYDLQTEFPIDIAVYCSTDGGKTYGKQLKSISGDVGKNISPGTNKSVIWNVPGDVNFIYGEEIVFKVEAVRVGYTGEMVYVESGTFQMGSNNEYFDEKPVHTVKVNSFYIGKYEVTQKQWREVMGSNPSGFKGCDNCPVEKVSWNDIQEFLRKLNAQTGENYRLPTEAEWEYASRGGNKSSGYKFSGSNNVSDVAWYNKNSGNKTHLAGQKHANELGIYDMSGNVWEWCNDWYDGDYYSGSPQNNPRGPASGSNRVFRGGGLLNFASRMHCSFRTSFSPGRRSDLIGFRLARDL